MTYDYFYGLQAEQFSFYRVPKALFTDAHLCGLSTDAKLLYGILLVMIYSLVLDKVMLLGTSRTEIKVVSAKAEEIRGAILQQMDRGVTMLDGEGGYARQPLQMIMSVVSNRELPRLEQIIHGIDPESFMVVSRVSEVRGRGFTLSKHYPN